MLLPLNGKKKKMQSDPAADHLTSPFFFFKQTFTKILFPFSSGISLTESKKGQISAAGPLCPLVAGRAETHQELLVSALTTNRL